MLPFFLLLLASTSDPDGPVICHDEKTALRGAYPPNGFKQWCELPGGVKQGAYRSWHPNGKTHEDFYFVNGKQHGHNVVYSPSRVPLSSGPYKAGLRHGIFRFQHPTETTDASGVPFVNDVPHGDGWRNLPTEGTLYFTFTRGKLTGSTRYEDLNHWVYRRCKVVNGKETSCILFFPKGKRSPPTEDESFSKEFALLALELCYELQPIRLPVDAPSLSSPFVKISITAIDHGKDIIVLETHVSKRTGALWSKGVRMIFTFLKKGETWKPKICPWKLPNLP